MHGAGLSFLLAFLFVSYGRLADGLAHGLYLPFVASLVALMVTVFTGGVPLALFSRVGGWLSAFCVWTLLAAPFSYWRSGTLELFLDLWLKSFLVFVIVAGLPRSVRDCRRVMWSIAAATIAITLMCLLRGSTLGDGRLILNDDGVLSNPNDLAQILLIGLPFVLLTALNKGRVPLTRFIGAICVVGVLRVTAATGSRGALVAFVGLTVMMILNLPRGNRLKVIATLALAIPLAASLLTADQRERYSLFSPGLSRDTAAQAAGAADSIEVSANDSTAQRQYVLRQSIELTLSHPLFGVGPGGFAAAAAKQSENQGERAAWRNPHNTYTEVSSEAGLPALIFYLGALVASLRTTRAIYKTSCAAGRLELANISYCLWLSLVAFALTALFGSVAYHMYFPMLAGLTVALDRSAAVEAGQVYGAALGAGATRPTKMSSVGVRSRPRAAV
jgi:O-antigen ligase